MGIRVLIDGVDYFIENYNYTEDSTPISGNDTTGGVGTLDFVIPEQSSPYDLVDKEVSLVDSGKGNTIGFVRGVNDSEDGAVVSVACQSRLGRLNIYNVQARPIRGTLEAAFKYYCRLAGETTKVYVDTTLRSREVNFQGWYGELWYYLKLMAASQDCEIALVSDTIVLRPLRQNEVINHLDFSRSRSYGGNTVAKSIEIYQYNNYPLDNKLIYPARAWNNPVNVITVPAGEYLEFDYELSASITSVQQPIPVDNMTYQLEGTSAYCITGNDDEPVKARDWRTFGGWVRVLIGEDTKSITVQVNAPVGIRDKRGKDQEAFSLAVNWHGNGILIPMLRLYGTGVGFNKTINTFPTCAPSNYVTTEVGITIDSPFISTSEEAYRVGIRAARAFSGENLELTGSFSPYGIVKGKESQFYGNLGGTRVWDEKTGRHYRIREANYNSSSSEISFSADDDLIYRDVAETLGDATYREIQTNMGNLSYQEIDRRNLSKLME